MDENAVKRGIPKAIVHPKFQNEHSAASNNIVLLKLNQSIPLSSVVKPIGLPSKDDQFESKFFYLPRSIQLLTKLNRRDQALLCKLQLVIKLV